MEAVPGLETKKELSQWEIDSLLGALALEGQEVQEAGPITQVSKNVRPYDFRRPDKFSKEHLRALQTIHESFARAASSALATYLRTGIQVRLSSVEQLVYGEYVQQLSNPTVMNIIGADPLPGHLIIELNFGLLFALIDRLLGGRGQIVQKVREVTDIELVLFNTLVTTLIGSLQETWLQLSAVTMKLDDLVFNPQIVQAALPGDVGILLLFELRMGDTPGTMTMFIPYTMLEPVMGKLSSQMWLWGAHKDLEIEREEIRQQLEKVEVPITVNLGKTTVSVREMLGLQVGNVIRLDTFTSQELEVLVSHKQKFWSRPGRVSRRLAVSISRVVAAEGVGTAHGMEASLVGGAG